MSIKLDDYHAQLDALAPELRAIIGASFAEAARVMSPAGLHNYLEGARGLAQLGRGTELVVAYIQNLPAGGKEAGEDVIQDCVTGGMKLPSLGGRGGRALL